MADLGILIGGSIQQQAQQLPWLDFADTGASIFQNLVTAIAVIVSGIFAYMRFLSGRIFGKRLEPHISGEAVRAGGKIYLNVNLSISNPMLKRIKVDPRYTALVVKLRKPASEDWELFTGYPTFQEIPEIKQARLEEAGVTPAVSVDAPIWIEIPNEEYSVAELVFRVAASPKLIWGARVIVPVPPEEDSQTGEDGTLLNELRGALKRWWTRTA